MTRRIIIGFRESLPRRFGDRSDQTDEGFCQRACKIRDLSIELAPKLLERSIAILASKLSELSKAVADTGIGPQNQADVRVRRPVRARYMLAGAYCTVRVPTLLITRATRD